MKASQLAQAGQVPADDRVFFHVTGPLSSTAPGADAVFKLKLAPRSAFRHLTAHLPLQRGPLGAGDAVLLWQDTVLDADATPQDYGMAAGERHVHHLRVAYRQSTSTEPSSSAQPSRSSSTAVDEDDMSMPQSRSESPGSSYVVPPRRGGAKPNTADPTYYAKRSVGAAAATHVRMPVPSYPSSLAEDSGIAPAPLARQQLVHVDETRWAATRDTPPTPLPSTVPFALQPVAAVAPPARMLRSPTPQQDLFADRGGHHGGTAKQTESNAALDARYQRPQSVPAAAAAVSGSLMTQPSATPVSQRSLVHSLEEAGNELSAVPSLPLKPVAMTSRDSAASDGDVPPPPPPAPAKASEHATTPRSAALSRRSSAAAMGSDVSLDPLEVMGTASRKSQLAAEASVAALHSQVHAEQARAADAARDAQVAWKACDERDAALHTKDRLIAELTQQLHGARAAAAAADSAQLQFATVASSAHQSAQEVDRLRVQVDQLKAANERVRQQYRDAEVAHTEALQAAANTADSALSREITELRRKVAALDMVTDQRDAAERKSSNAARRLEELQKDHERLQQDYEGLRFFSEKQSNEFTAMATELASVRAEYSESMLELRRQVESLNAQNDALLNESAMSSQNAIRMQSQMRAVQERAAQDAAVASRVAGLETALDAKDGELMAKQSDLAKWQKTATELNATVQSLRADVVSGNEAISRLQRESDQLRRDVRAAERAADEAVANANRERRRSQEDNLALKATCSDLEASLLECNSVIMEVQQENAKLRRAVIDLQQQLIDVQTAQPAVVTASSPWQSRDAQRHGLSAVQSNPTTAPSRSSSVRPPLSEPGSGFGPGAVGARPNKARLPGQSNAPSRSEPGSRHSSSSPTRHPHHIANHGDQDSVLH